MNRLIIAVGALIGAISFVNYMKLMETGEIPEIPCNILEIMEDNTIKCKWRRNPVVVWECDTIELAEGQKDEFVCTKGSKKWIIHQMDSFFGETKLPELKKADADYWKNRR